MSPSTATTTCAWCRRPRWRPHYAEAFRLPLERFVSRLGIPRTDVLFGDERIAGVVADLRERYAIPDGHRVILYAPTFRGDSVADATASDGLDLRRLRDVLGDDHVVLVRLHPFIRDHAPIDPALAGFAIDVSDHADINELLLVSDLLVTDYSSVIYEFSLLGRPMVFFAPDRAAYERERGFYFDYRSGVAGPGLRDDRAARAAHPRRGVRPRPCRGLPGGVVRCRRRPGDGPLRRGDRAARAAPQGLTAGPIRVCWHAREGAVRYAPRPSRRQPVEHATGPFTSHDLPSQTRRQALPPSLVGEPGPTQLLHEPRLRPRRRRRRRHPPRRRRADLVQRPSRLGRQRRRQVDHQGRVRRPPRHRGLAPATRPRAGSGRRSSRGTLRTPRPRRSSSWSPSSSSRSPRSRSSGSSTRSSRRALAAEEGVTVHRRRCRRPPGHRSDVARVAPRLGHRGRAPDRRRRRRADRRPEGRRQGQGRRRPRGPPERQGLGRGRQDRLDRQLDRAAGRRPRLDPEGRRPARRGLRHRAVRGTERHADRRPPG